MRLLLVILLLFAVTTGLPGRFASTGAGQIAAPVDVPCDGDELPPIASAIVIDDDDTALPAMTSRALVGRLPERPLLRPPIA